MTLALTTNPAAGDVTGNYSVGLGVATVGGQTAANIGSATNTVITAPALDLDTSDDLTLTTNPAAGDVTGNYSVGLGVATVGGQTAANIGSATNTVITAPALDLDTSDDLALTTNPAAGDVTGNYSVGLGVATVGGQTAANIGSATNTVITAPALDLDTSDDGDMLAATYDPGAITGDAFNMSNHITTTAGTPGDLLTFNAGVWDAQAPTISGDMFAATYDPGTIAGDAFALGIHTTVTPAVGGDVLTWNGANWDAAAPVVSGDMFAATYDPGTIAGDAFALGIHTTATPAVGGDLLTWNGASWDAAAPVVTGDMFVATYDPGTIAGDAFDLGIHTTPTPAVGGDLLTWNGANWDAAAPGSQW